MGDEEKKIFFDLKQKKYLKIRQKYIRYKSFVTVFIVVSNWYFEVSYAEQLGCYSRAAGSVTKACEH